MRTQALPGVGQLPSCTTHSLAPTKLARQPAAFNTRRMPRQQHVARTAAQAQSNGTGSGGAGIPQVRTVESLNNPARIGATSSKQTQVQEVAGLPLDAYMRLPVEQYYELDPTMIKPLGGTRFLLTVPRIQLFNVWLEPVVQVEVTHGANAESVTIQAVSCSLNGSDLVQNLGLDKRFVLKFNTVLTWDSPGSRAPAAGSPEADAAALSPAADAKPGTIFAELQLQVWSEVLTPFTLLPRDVLEGTANAVLGGLVSALLPVFVRKLGSDYERWASDPEYRQRRAAQAAAAASATPV